MSRGKSRMCTLSDCSRRHNLKKVKRLQVKAKSNVLTLSSEKVKPVHTVVFRAEPLVMYPALYLRVGFQLEKHRQMIGVKATIAPPAPIVRFFGFVASPIKSDGSEMCNFDISRHGYK